MFERIKKLFSDHHAPKHTGLQIVKYIGPGLLVTVGFIDPGNWASNVAAGATYGYELLWMVTLSTIMLIFLQHNAAHLGIATGLCLSEAATVHLRPLYSRLILGTALLAVIVTAMAEILGGAIALQLLFKIPLKLGSVMVAVLVGWMLFSNSYRKIERIIIGFVSLIGVSFIFEIFMVDTEWVSAAKGWVLPSVPMGAWPIVMSVLGAVVMPHNLFLHSEIIQSRQWNLESEEIINKQLKYEFLDTLLSMSIGWAINSAMLIIAAATFFAAGIQVTELGQAKEMLEPLVNEAASVIFAVALLLAGIASSVTAGFTGGTIVSGMFKEPYDIADNHSRLGVGITMLGALLVIFFISDPFEGLVYSQMMLSIQLPITIFLLIGLTSSRKVMGQYANSSWDKIVLWCIGLVVSFLNVMLLVNFLNS